MRRFMRRMAASGGCGNKVLFFLYLSTLFTYIHSVEPEIPWYQQKKEILEQHSIEGTTLQEMVWTYNDAPEMVRDCVRHLEDPNFYRLPQYRALFLYGDSGSGKSTLAKAIAQYAGWDQIFYTPQDIQGTERGRGAEKLRNKLNEIIERKTKTVVILDEINQILEHAESEHHDNDATSKEFWTYLDKVHGNNNFFLIGTANQLHKIPQQVKSRIKPFACEINAPRTLSKKKEIFMRHMESSWTQVDTSALEPIENIIKKHNKWTARDYADFAALCKIVYRETDKKSPVMKFAKPHVLEALRRTTKNEEDLHYGERELTHVERQELHFAQNHYIQILTQRQQKVPVNWSFGVISGGRASGIKKNDGDWILHKGLNKEQNRLLHQELEHFGEDEDIDEE